MNMCPDCSTCMYLFKESYEYPCKRCHDASHWKLNGEKRGGKTPPAKASPPRKTHSDITKTNGDRWRSLPDEELAKAIARKISGCYGCPVTNELDCAECVLEWLRKEADE